MYRFNEGQITLIDRREMLRVKWKTLKTEIKYIKLEERKTFGQLQTELYRHRLGLEAEALATLAAYQTVRYGGPLITVPSSLEAKVKTMLERYGKLATPLVEQAYRPLRCDRLRKKTRKAARREALLRRNEKKAQPAFA